MKEKKRKPKSYSSRSSKSHPPKHSSTQPSSRRSNQRGRRAASKRTPAFVGKATVDKNRKGFAFLTLENRNYEDVYVPAEQAEYLFQGDRVEVSLDAQRRLRSIRVLNHRCREIIGRFEPVPQLGQSLGHTASGHLIYERKQTQEVVFLPQVDPAIQAQDWIRIQLHFHEKGPFPVTGTVLHHYGPHLPTSADIERVATEFGLTEFHSAGALQEAQHWQNDSIHSSSKHLDWENRVDLRHLPFITIDGETARDFDDAIFVERNSEGYLLWVAIADVSYYVTEGSLLDQEAQMRGTSVYFPERAFHMLPSVLSENLCSLKPHEPRLCLIAQIQCNRQGKRAHTQILEGIIQSQRRATYLEIQAEWDQNCHHQNWENWALAPHVELYRVIRENRKNRGSIDFELPETEISTTNDGDVISIQQRLRVDAHRLIEEFMITANEAVTEWMLAQHWPFVYRIHEPPSPAAFKKFEMLAHSLGFQIALKPPISPQAVSKLLKKFEGSPLQPLLNKTLLRAMKQAVYSSVHRPHFGLASPAYTHFTSPIRRYPDLLVHRLIRKTLRQKARLTSHLREALEKDLAQLCEDASYKEQLAAEAEREAARIKQVRIMMKHLGQEFSGMIGSMTATGLFIQLHEPFVEGFVPIDTLKDDFYEFREKEMIFVGRRKKKKISLGQSCRIQVARADLDRRQVEFIMLK